MVPFHNCRYCLRVHLRNCLKCTYVHLRNCRLWLYKATHNLLDKLINNELSINQCLYHPFLQILQVSQGTVWLYWWGMLLRLPYWVHQLPYTCLCLPLWRPRKKRIPKIESILQNVQVSISLLLSSPEKNQDLQEARLQLNNF